MHAHNSTNRFSDRVDNYDTYRPLYPPAIIEFLQQNAGLNKQSVIADIGSGTGIFSKLLLAEGYMVKAVEPNLEMRSAAVGNLQVYNSFESINGTAEDTGLAAASVDLITVAQAFHWFNQEKIKPEFSRILKPGGYALLVWNIPQTDTAFLKAYAVLKDKYAEKLVHPSRANLENIRAFFAPHRVITKQIRNIQWLDKNGLEGHLLSFSTVPTAADEKYKYMMEELDALYNTYANNGLLKMEYETMLFLAQMADS